MLQFRIQKLGIIKFRCLQTINAYLQSGTAKMGQDSMFVADAKLKVYGVEPLRVADASILTRVTTGNTMAPCVVTGELAADFLQHERLE
jgi:choline dehydrogenase